MKRFFYNLQLLNKEIPTEVILCFCTKFKLFMYITVTFWESPYVIVIKDLWNSNCICMAKSA